MAERSDSSPTLRRGLAIAFAFAALAGAAGALGWPALADRMQNREVAAEAPPSAVPAAPAAVAAGPTDEAHVAADAAAPAVAEATGAAETSAGAPQGDSAGSAINVGWLRVVAPFSVQLVEDGEVVGTNDATRIMLAAGLHDLRVMNLALEYQETRRVTVSPGQVMTLRIEPPSVEINLNARPWADVTVDGVAVGQTPIANAAVSVGTRQIVFRHPELGERQETVVVTTRAGQRFAVDLTK